MNIKNTKRITSIFIIAALFCALLAGCSKVDFDTPQPIASSRFVMLSAYEELNEGEFILCDTETGVMYLNYYHGYDSGITVLLDADGRPLIYEPFRAEGGIE